MSQQLLAAYESRVGRVLLGRYRVVRELAKGGMGIVYLARSEGAVGFVKPVVIKLLLPEHHEDPRIVNMFVREARILSQLRHPSLVDVIEFGEEGGAYVLVLEYVRGYHLGLWLRYLATKQREAPADILLQIIIDVLDALHHAHTLHHPDGSSMQIVHRDVSPSNILLDETGRARLLDFGVARMRGGGQDYKTQVQGGFMGKLPYTAPEMFAGSDASPKSDLYACAVVLHEALYGQNVFRAETQAATLQRVLNHVAEAVEPKRADAPAGLDGVLACALAKAVSTRHDDARELAAALRHLQTTPESELRARLAQLLTDDFGAEMSQLLNLDSLSDREVAWRSANPGPQHEAIGAPANSNAALDPRVLSSQAPAPLGATAGNTRPRRATGRPPPPLEDAGSEPVALQPSAAGSGLTTAPDPECKPIPEPKAPAAAPRESAARGRLRGLALGIGVGLIACAAIALFTLQPPRAAPTRPAVRVVQLPAAPTTPPTTPAPLDSPAPPAPVASPAPPITRATPPPSAATPEHAERGADKERPKHAAATPNPNALSRALRKQQPRLENCFRQNSVSLEGRATTQLVFEVDASGAPTHVELAPRMLTNTALGQCLLRVARSTRFPAQPRPVSFVIPLTASTNPDG